MTKPPLPNPETDHWEKVPIPSLKPGMVISRFPPTIIRTQALLIKLEWVDAKYTTWEALIYTKQRSGDWYIGSYTLYMGDKVYALNGSNQ